MGLVEVGDAEAFAALYDRHGRMAYSLAYRMMGEKQEAADVVQEAFIKVWRSAGGCRVGRGDGRRPPGRARERAHLDPLRRTQPWHRPDPLPRESRQDAGEGRGFRAHLRAQRGLRRDLEKRPARTGARSAEHPTARAAEDTGAGILLRLHSHRDRRAARVAPRYGQGPNEARAAEAPGLLPSARSSGAQMNGMDQERFEDLKDAYVLGALPEEECLEFEQYLLTNPDLQAEVEKLGAVAGLLA